MKYTQEQLEAMSDLEINKEAALLFYKYNDSIILNESPHEDCSVWVVCDGTLTNTNYNPCDNWEDCGELVDECGISVEFDCETHDDHPQSWWNAHFLDRVVTMHHRNPKRAITIVYILVKQEKG